jgi:antitoxin YefM
VEVEMNTITATRARSDLFNLIKKIVKGHRQVKITTKEGTAVLLSEEEYENLLETLHLLSMPGLKDSISEADEEISRGETYSIDEVFE